MRLLPMSAVLGIALFTLAGCGQKGPLYMPDDEQASEQYDPQGAYENDTAAPSGPDTPGEDDAATPPPDSDAD